MECLYLIVMCCFYSKSIPISPGFHLTSLQTLGIQVEMGKARQETEEVRSSHEPPVLTGGQPQRGAGAWTSSAGVLLTGWVGWDNLEPGLPPPGDSGLALPRCPVCGCAPFRPLQGGHVLWPRKERSRQRKAWLLQWHWPLTRLLYCSVN